MTCFWDGILQALDLSDYQHVGCNNNLNKVKLIHFLKTKNRLIKNVTWNNTIIKNQEQTEHFNAIKNYNINHINRGHDCSTCDYFLLLISELFNVNIKHLYRNNMIYYKNIKQSRKTLNFISNSGHFWKK
jgi:hypothetical protein